jgi:hypothetical protein
MHRVISSNRERRKFFAAQWWRGVLRRTGHSLSREVQKLRFDFVVMEVEEGDAAFQAETAFAGVTGIEIPDAVDGLIEGLVRVAEDNEVRFFALNAVGKQHGGGFRHHDVLQQKFVAAQFEDLNLFQRQHGIGVAGDGGDGRDSFQFGENRRSADVAGVDDVFDPLEQFGDAFVDEIMCVGDDAYLHFVWR